MTNERWEQFIENAHNVFENVVVTSEDLLDPTGEFAPGTADSAEFTLPGSGRYRVVRENKPVVLEKKMHYSHQQGATARSEYVLSDSEFSHKIKVFKQDEDDEWEEVRPESLGL
ncbi:MAG: hypothetical protein M3Q64_03380 [bacterium]|nr:hypothetical protein [bacterium]